MRPEIKMSDFLDHLNNYTYRFAIVRPANGLGQDAAHVNNFDLIALAPVVTLRH